MEKCSEDRQPCAWADASHFPAKLMSGREKTLLEGRLLILLAKAPDCGGYIGCAAASSLASCVAVPQSHASEVPVVFAGSRRFAEEWADRFLGAAVSVGAEST